jgi:hypothetical protein
MRIKCVAARLFQACELTFCSAPKRKQRMILGTKVEILKAGGELRRGLLARSLKKSMESDRPGQPKTFLGNFLVRVKRNFHDRSLIPLNTVCLD